MILPKFDRLTSPQDPHDGQNKNNCGVEQFCDMTELNFKNFWIQKRFDSILKNVYLDAVK